MVLLTEIKAALSTCEYELQSLRHQYEALNPGKVTPSFKNIIKCTCNIARSFERLFLLLFQMLAIPHQLLANSDVETKVNVGEIIDVVGSPGTPSNT